MRFRRSLGVLSLALLAGLVPLAAPPAARAGGLPWFGKEESKPPVILLAEMIDDVEDSLNEMGTVVAKKPDVWGESRLTKHRQEVEEQLAKKIGDFQLLLNASSAVSDQAFLANAIAISAALGSNPNIPSAGTVDPDGADGPQQDVNIISTSNQVSDLTTPPTYDGEGNITSDSTIFRTDPSGFPLTSALAGNLNVGEASLGFGAGGKLSLEPTLQLDQLKRYLDHLNELRRLNEGGDTADAPGYSLNLVRIPVSILPGDETRKGHGAEITVSAEMHLTRELLPTTFRSLVIQDLVDQLSLPLIKLAEAEPWAKDACVCERQALCKLNVELDTLLRDASQLQSRIEAWINTGKPGGEKSDFFNEIAELRDRIKHAKVDLNRISEICRGSASAIVERNASEQNQSSLNQFAVNNMTNLDAAPEALRAFQQDVIGLISEVEGLTRDITTLAGEVETVITSAVERLPSSSSRTRRARYGVPPSRLTDVFGSVELFVLAKRMKALTQQQCEGVTHLSDARAFLNEELQAAYDYLSLPDKFEMWNCVPMLAHDIRSNADLAEQRSAITECGATVKQSLAWAILVEAALLDQRLNEDFERVSQDPNCHCLFAGPYAFYLPEPPEEARLAFMDYVHCRWPIHVFALDPVTQDQNIAEAFSMRRELQLAAALAFASGSATASDTLRFVRRLEIEEQAIALNRTAVAFAHGANTFGWRFRPRFQTMDIESNAVVVGRDLLWGGPSRDARMKDWRMEPGMRECVALVVMPSFVPHVRFDVRSNWFKLTNPDNVEGKMVKTVKLSRQIRDMQRLMEVCSLASDNYRPGEMQRLFARVEQLSDKIPLQTLYAQVPYENTTGGFELFSSGVTDLSPELIDFYGAPGIDPAAPTTLFLVGKNFSVHQTRIVAGNVEVTDVELLSRDVMKITIPAGARTVQCCRPARTPEAVGVPLEVSPALPVPPAPANELTGMKLPASPVGRAIVRTSGVESESGPLLAQVSEEVAPPPARQEPEPPIDVFTPQPEKHSLVEINPTLNVEVQDSFTFEINKSTVAPSPVGVPVPACASSTCLPTAPCTGTSICQDGSSFCKSGEQDYEAVEIHLATPYGVSGRLLIPVIRRARVNVPPACGLTWSPSSSAVTYSWTGIQKVLNGDKEVPSLSILSILPTGDSLVLQAPSGIGLPSPVKMNVHGQMRILKPDTGMLGFAPIAFPLDSVACDSRGYVLSGGTLQAFHVELANGIKAQLLNLAKQNPVLIEKGVKHIQVRVEVEIVTTGGVRPSVAAPLVIDVWLKKP